MTDRLAEIRTRLEAAYPAGNKPEPWGGWSEALAHIAYLLAEVERLREEFRIQIEGK